MSSDALTSGLPPASDRLLTTIFLAALLHAVVILGVSFSAPRHTANDRDTPSMDVVLVDDNTPSAARNTTAPYLAERNQRGSGNTLEPQSALIPKSSLMAAGRPGVSGGDGSAESSRTGESGTDEVLATQGRATRILYFSAREAADANPEPQLLLTNIATVGVNPNEEGVALRMRGETRKDLWVTADTRESEVAVYLDRWRHKVERVGTLNFPGVAHRYRNAATPVIEVTIAADGKLLKTLVRHTSGHAELDQAAMRILKLAAPFDAFPADMRRLHDEIRIAYEWQFLGDMPSGVTVPGEP